MSRALAVSLALTLAAGAASAEIVGRRIIRITNVTVPTMTVYLPPEAQRTGTAVLVFPGGAYRYAPSTFLVQTQDDPVRVENSLAYYAALKAANVPVEMHLYPTGGHGYGLRRLPHTVGTWPARAVEWMQSLGPGGATLARRGQGRTPPPGENSHEQRAGGGCR